MNSTIEAVTEKPITEQPKTEKNRIQSNRVVILFCNIFTQGNYEAKERWALNRMKVKRNKWKLNKVCQQTKERLLITLYYQYVMLCLLLVFDVLVPSQKNLHHRK